MSDRTLLRIFGADARSFLQNLITNDVEKTKNGLVYAALLTPQGKYIADFFVLERGDDLFIDVARSHARPLAQRLTMYRLRADVTVEESTLLVRTGTGPRPEKALQDPRHDGMGWRLYGADSGSDDTDWDALRVAHVIPETGIELTEDTYILEAGFERLNGIDFRKGCYVGQEIAARMKHKTELKKGLVQVAVSTPIPAGTPITAQGKPAGTVYTHSDGLAIAHLRFDRASGDMEAGGAIVSRTTT